MVKEVWNRPLKGNSAILRWNNKIRALRKHLREWARHISGLYKKEKKRLAGIIDTLETVAETQVLLQHELELKNQANEQIARLLREELKWCQRSKAQFILEGDSNTRYFHMVANGRHRKKYIHTLHQDEGTIEGQNELKKYITKYYKTLFGPPEEANFSLDESQTGDIPQVSNEENAFLTAPFTEEEVRKAIFEMEHNKAPGPDGFLAEFYHTFWDITKVDLLELFNDLHKGQLKLFKLNFGDIIMLPKMKDADRIQ
jgi:mannosylglycoprotein endo-beta-mannosidase